MSLLGDESPYDLIDAFIRGEMERLVAHCFASITLYLSSPSFFIL